MTSVRVLITGGAGYIGSHTLRALRARGDDVVVFDDLSKGHRQAVPEEILETGSLLDRAAVKRLFDRTPFDAVMHFASHCLVGESVAEPRKYFRDNLVGAVTLLEEMLDHGVGRFVFSSSCATYGDPIAVPIDEDHPQSPVNPYGETKLAIERMLRAYGAAYGLRSISLRYFNAAGADPSAEIGEKHDPESHLVPLVLDAVYDPAKSITIHGEDYPTPDGTCIRDYVHVVDLADAHARALDRLESVSSAEAFNLGTGQGHSVREVIEAAERLTGRKVRTQVGPRRAGDPPALVARAERARVALGWEPRHSSLETILRTAWAWRQRRDTVFPG
jgi:UDP-glucose-4-epimerase GalE